MNIFVIMTLFILLVIENSKVHLKSMQIICDMIKGNESDVGNIDFELQAKRGDIFVYFMLFLNLKNCSYRCNHMSD